MVVNAPSSGYESLMHGGAVGGASSSVIASHRPFRGGSPWRISPELSQCSAGFHIESAAAKRCPDSCSFPGFFGRP